MKCLSLYQPWASLIAAGWKTVETRDWYTGHRGALAIHAATKRDMEGKVIHAAYPEMFLRVDHWENRTDGPPVPITYQKQFADLPFGAIVATCMLGACLPTAMVADIVAKLKPPFFPSHGWEVESRLGNYAPGRWAWILRDIKPLARPIVFAGKRKLFDIPFDTAAALHLAAEKSAADATKASGSAPPPAGAPSSKV